MTSEPVSLVSQALALTKSPAFGAAGKAMGELGVAGCIGAACVKQKTVTPEMIRAMSKAIYNILLPLFIGTNLMKTVTSQGGRVGRSALAVPMTAALQAGILFVLSSKIIIPMFGMDPDSDEGKVLAITCCFGNAGVLPFIFSESVFRSNPQLLQQAYSQVSFFSAGWSPFFWSFVPKVLQISKKDPSLTTEKSGLAKMLREIKMFFPPPVVGVCTGILIGLSPFSSLLLSNNQQEAAPLVVIYNSCQNLGKAASPLAVLVLTCSLAFGAQKKSQKTTTDLSSETIVGPMRKWACVSTARFIVSPMVMLGMLYTMDSMGIIGTREAEPMLWFTCMLQSVMPPAQNSVVLLQVAGRSDEANQMAKFLFTIYATAMLPIIGMVTTALQSLHIVP